MKYPDELDGKSINVKVMKDEPVKEEGDILIEVKVDTQWGHVNPNHTIETIPPPELATDQ